MTHLSPDARHLIAQTRHGDDPSAEDERRVGRSLARRVQLAATALTIGIGATGAAKSAVATGLALGWGKVVVGAVVGVGVAVAIAVPLGMLEPDTAVVDRATPGVGARGPQQASLPGPSARSDSTPPSRIAELPPTPIATTPALARPLSPPAPAGLPASPLVRSDEAPVGPSGNVGPAVARFAPEPVASSSRLAAETAALRSAQGALRSGNPARALALVDQQSTQYSEGALSQERAAARVFALCDLGRNAEAHAEIRRFERRWPRSPLVARVREACLGR